MFEFQAQGVFERGKRHNTTKSQLFHLLRHFYSLNRKKMKKKKTYLREKRDKRVFERYLYWTEQQRMRFDDTIRRLSEEEFFLTEDYILAIIKKEKARNEAEGLDIPRHRYLSVAL